VLLEIIREN